MKYLTGLLLLLFHITTLAQPKEDSIALFTSTGTISGSLFVPEGKASFPVLLVIAGSGPTDRYGNNPLGVKANSYKMLAEALCTQNIGVLLFDKRGVAKSAGAAKKEVDLRFENYVNDVVEWVEQLKKDKRVKGIFIAGHSEGSLIGMLAAQKVNVQGYISIAGPARGIAEIIVRQYTEQLPKAGPIVDSLFNRLQNNQSIGSVPPYLMAIFRPSVQPYIKSWMKYIPCDEIKKLAVPTLIIQGGTDIQVAPEEAALLKKCKENAGIFLLDSMNHILKNAPANRAQNIATYSNPALPLSVGLTNAIVLFIKENSN
jgi:pimeloyl-ACP methyl ester carboxylesterase